MFCVSVYYEIINFKKINLSLTDEKYLFLISATVFLAGCDAMNYGTYNRFPRYPSYPGSSNTSMANTEREYNELLKTYKPETEAVLNDLLNSTDPNAINTSIVIKMNLPAIWFYHQRK